MEKPTKERYGSIVKFEPLCPIKDDAAMDNTLAFECPQPFHGYYSHHPEQHQPLYIYFALKDYLSLERFIFIRQNIKKKFDKPFHATLAHIKVYDESFNAIRVRRIEDYSAVRELQLRFADHGVRFHKQHRQFTTVDRAEIRVKKFFKLEEIGDGFYHDLTDQNHYYFKIDYHLSAERFEEIAKQVTFNTDLIDFDCALAFFYEDYQIVDIVRIYTDTGNINIARLNELKQLCTNALKRFVE